MRRSTLTLTAALLLATIAAPQAEAAWGGCRLRSLTGNVAGGVLARLDDSAWIFSTTLGETLQEIHFSSRDLRRFHAEVEKGSLVVVLDSERINGELFATKWCPVRRGNPLRAGFLKHFADEMLLRGLYSDVASLAEIFDGRRADLLPLGEHLVGMASALVDLGVTSHLRPLAELVARHGFLARPTAEACAEFVAEAVEPEETECTEIVDWRPPIGCDLGKLHTSLTTITATTAKLVDNPNHGAGEHSKLHDLAEKAQTAAANCLPRNR